jgi:hypothetical protein
MVETTPFSGKETNMACCTNDYTPSIPAEEQRRNIPWLPG